MSLAYEHLIFFFRNQTRIFIFKQNSFVSEVQQNIIFRAKEYDHLVDGIEVFISFLFCEINHRKELDPQFNFCFPS